MSPLDEFLDDEPEPVPDSTPPKPIVTGNEAIIARILARAEAAGFEERTYRCGGPHGCLDRFWVVHDGGGAWPCVRCEGGKGVLVTHWLNICFPVEPRFNKRISSGEGQEEFNKYLDAFPEQEGWLRAGIDQRRREDQAAGNRQQQEGRRWT